MTATADIRDTIARFEAAVDAQPPTARTPLDGKVILGMEQGLLAAFLNTDLGAYYGGEAEDQITYQLRAQQFMATQFPELGHRLNRGVYADLGAGLAATVLGVPWQPRSTGVPWARGACPVRCEQDLDGRPMPDFHGAGMMPMLIRLYEDMGRIVGNGWHVGFPTWTRGPLGNAFYLAGAERTLTTMREEPAFYHRLMRFGMDAMTHWLRARAAYLGEPIPSASTLFNDEVSAENFPADVYETLTAPYDREYLEFFGGDVVFHSCGKTTPLMPVIAKVAPWAAFHVSAWSDLDTALAVFPDTPLLVCLHPYRDVLGATLAHTAKRIESIAAKCAGHEHRICITELMLVNGPEADLAKLKEVVALCVDLLA